MLYLFHDNGEGKDPDYLGKFKTRAALEKYVVKDIATLSKQYPDVKWSRRDYLVARRVK